MSDVLIRGGRVMDPASGRDEIADILVRDGRIAAIGPELLCTEPDTEVIEAAGLVAAPGFVDVHVHFRDPGFPEKEDILTGAAAAARGGYTTVIMMANTEPRIDCPEVLSQVLEKGKQTGIHVLSCANVTVGMKGREIVAMEELKKAGAAGFTDDGVPILDEKIVREACERVAALGVPISFHEEDPKYIETNGINRGKASEYYGVGGSSREAEYSMVERDVRIAAETGADIDIQHISTKEAVELVRQARRDHKNVHAEATPHHFTLTEEAVIRYGSLAKMNPPLREEEDRLAIIEGLADGTIEMIATDHAPHTAEEKARPITKAPSGIIGLETAFSLGIYSLVKPGHLTLMQLLEKMTVNPARLYHLDAGILTVGGPADLVLLDPEATVTYTEYASRATNTPFTGWELPGQVVRTICNGHTVWKA